MVPILTLYDRIPSWLKNRYVVTILAFLTWMTFFDDHNIISRVKGYSALREARAKKKYYAKEIEKGKEDMLLLTSGPEALEKFAREEYRMKRDDEDIYVFIDTMSIDN